MEDMPDEVLLHIFNFLSANDLVFRVSNVCKRWDEVVRGKILWTNRVFTPPVTMKDDEITECIAKLPNLKHFRLKHGKDIDRIVDVLCRNCPNIRTVIMERKRGPSRQKIHRMNFFMNLKDLKTFDVFMPRKIFQFDYAKLNGNFRSVNSSLFMIGGDMEEEKFRFFGRIQQNLLSITNNDEETIEILTQRQESLEYLVFCSKMNKRISEHIYKCKNLKTFFFFGNKQGMHVISFEDMAKLEELHTLQLIVPLNSVILFKPTSNQYFSKLVKLEIYCNCLLKTDELRKLWPLCPNLQHLRLEANYLKDEVFEGIENCKLLKHIDVSYNMPGLYNDCLEFIARGCPNLEFLDLSHSLTPFNYDLSLLAPCKKLSCLWLENQIITWVHVYIIPKLFPNLTELNVKHCKTISLNLVRQLERKMKSLNVIWGHGHLA